ncbi:group II intron reverse transcriptase/maturase [Bacillus thuringiensis]|uniref:group II intron reverse transcriptase/maturase n=1 Tax=Bacillus thuringiensis TaxID=1428 RepID=UPI000BFDBC47|nr:group II intron reverse transcriptase/maturase [Bacillus thuringiensis]PGW33904.1 group II intron reverse transcriptase/maturase [Bacillus thuringiensis]
MPTKETRYKKRQQLRNIEYYDLQEVQDTLYKQSKEDKRFTSLMEIITSRENILLAYRNIKKNKGSQTAGTNKRTILDISSEYEERVVTYVRNRLVHYTPHKVRRVEIAKENGKKRPLGIPTIEDRLIQQCIKQVLEPICEAKFYKHSYGFRNNRSTHHAISRCASLVNRSHLHYVVDIDIKGFFDNVNHGKLLKQMWYMGIRDKKLLSILSKMLKAEIKGIGVPKKGTPQGGILSPLLSNIVLNELDWWISDQWETFQTKRDYGRYRDASNRLDNSNKYREMRKTRLKMMYIVRYADDFKIFCKDAKSAQKTYVAVKKWLNERLGLEISPEKSQVTNLKKNYTDFLGFKLKVWNKGKKKLLKSHVSNKAKQRIIEKIKESITKIKSNPSTNEANRFNALILGFHNYYKVATNVSVDFAQIAFLVKKNLYNSTKSIRGSTGLQTKTYRKLYGKYNFKPVYISKVALFPIAGIRTSPPMNFKQYICNYTIEGRKYIHDKLNEMNTWYIQYLLKNIRPEESIELNDNKISLLVGQNGKCGVTKEFLMIGDMELHHKIPKYKGGNDSYTNLIYVKKDVHRLIHVTDGDKIKKYMNKIQLDEQGLAKINMLRKLVGNCLIEVSTNY